VQAQHDVRLDDQVQALEHIPRQPVQQRCQECTIARSELHPLRAELALEHREHDGAGPRSPYPCPDR
jgi:hypothetical protein